MRSITVVGASLAGLSTVRALRAEGYAAQRLLGVRTLRTLDDALALRAELLDGLPRVVVIGAGFIGAEVASTAHRLGLHVTVVEALEVPLERQPGREMGLVCASLHHDHGVRLLCGTGVAGLIGEGRVTGARLADGRVLPAGIVVVGVGVRPAHRLAGRFRCPGGRRGGLRRRLRDRRPRGRRRRRCRPLPPPVHRTARPHRALEQRHRAGAYGRPHLLTGVPAPAPLTAPYFWSDQYQVRVQLAGQVVPGAEPEIVEGDVDSRTFTAVYRSEGAPVAVLSLNQPKFFNRLRRTLVPATAATVV
ncbi:FAD-dependent oxidoreductase [Streptomyces sp. NPDC002643]